MPGPGTWAAGDILTAADLNAIGVWSTYTPVLVQNGTRTATVNYASYVQINKMCAVNVDLTCTTAGSAGNIVTVSLPVNSNTSSPVAVGTGLIFDDSGSDVILVTPVINSASTVRFAADATTSYSSAWGANPSVALANNDVISFSIIYRTV
jgi:hypothetical protein